MTTESVQDIVGAMVSAAGGSYDDAAGTITLPSGGATRGLIITDINVAAIPAGDGVDNIAAYYNSSATPITVQGTTIAAGAHAVWAWVSGAWVLLAAGTGATADTAAPVWPSGAYAAVSNPTDTTATVALSALPVDDTAVAKYQVRVYVAGDSGTASWADATISGTTISLVGLTPSTVYQPVEVRALDAAGNASAVLYTNTGLTTTAPPALTFSKVYFSDSFNRPDGQAGTLDNAYGGTTNPVPTWGTDAAITVASNQLSITTMNKLRDLAFGENAPGAALRFKRTSTYFNVGFLVWCGRMSTGGSPAPIFGELSIKRETTGALLAYPNPATAATTGGILNVALNGGSEFGVWSLKVDPDGTCTAISPSGLTTTATWWVDGDTAGSGRYASAVRISSYGFNAVTTLDDLVVGVKA